MKINPPEPLIDDKKPFGNNLFGREEFGKSLTSVLRNISENLVIFVNAPWGAGKTTFSKMWIADLRQQKLEVIYFNSYAADFFDDPFVSFSGEILGFIDSRLSDGKGLVERREFKDTAVEVGKRLAGLAAKIGLRAATLGTIESSHIEELKKIGNEVAAEVSEIGADVIEKKIENYAAEKNSLESFRKSLAKLAAKVKAEQGFPLTIVVDELDRCRPDFALSLLERMKHLFDVDGVAFVLLVNRDQIESYIRAVYGDQVDARAYLLKFGSIFVDLPNHTHSSFQYLNGNQEFCAKLVQHYELSTQVVDHRYLALYVAVFADQLSLTLREIEKTFTFMTIFFALIANRHQSNVFIVALLSVLKVKKPSLYKALSRDEVSLADFYQQSGLNLKIVRKENFSVEWAENMLDAHLMSDDEFELATKGKDGSNPTRPMMLDMVCIGRYRKQIIPSLCNKLDQFSLQP